MQFGLFHGDPHPGNIFALRDGRIAYVDFGNVAEVSQQNKQTLIDAVVHAVNEDYEEMAKDFIKLVRLFHCSEHISFVNFATAQLKVSCCGSCAQAANASPELSAPCKSLTESLKALGPLAHQGIFVH